MKSKGSWPNIHWASLKIPSHSERSCCRCCFQDFN
jgi:hypothetical protein